MSLWIPRMGDAAHDERLKRALICAVLSYLLFLLVVIMSFMPARKTVAVSVGQCGKPSVVKWSGHVSSGRGKRGRRSRFKGSNRSVAKMSAIAPVKKPVGKAVSYKKLSRRERIAERNRLRKASKIKKIAARKIEQKEQNKQIARKVDSSRPPILEKIVEKKLEKKQKKAVVSAIVKESKQEKEREQAVVVQPEKVESTGVPKQEPVVATVVPVVQPTTEPEPAPVFDPEPTSAPELVAEQDMLEIGVGGQVDDNQDASDIGSDGDSEVSRDEYALICAVGRTWRQPHGLKPGLSARLVVALSAQGKVERVDIETSSRVPAYDMAARGALYRAEYPAVFWGKNIAVVFGQNG